VNGRASPAEEREARAGLSRAAEPGLPGLGQLIDSVGPVAAWHALRSADPRVTSSGLAGVALRAARADPAADLAAIEACGGRLICPGEPEWPAELRVLESAHVAPVALWVRGGGHLAALCQRAVAVVGTRAPSEYGAFVAGELAAGLVDRGYTVFSGAAYGIDAAAHRGALAADGATVALLACGVDVAYPRAHTGLLDRICERGLVVSEHPPGTAPFRSRFLQRNRLIAALTAATVVVEAALRSGALSTAAHAGRQGRPVLAVPGPITSSTSAGCHRLIREFGATLITGLDEVLEVIGRIGADLAPDVQFRGRADALPAEAKRVLDAVPLHRPAAAENLARTACVDPATLLGCLGLLAGLGLVEQAGGGWRVSRSRAGAPRAGRSDPAQLLLED
jgi:DNA processing protein